MAEFAHRLSTSEPPAKLVCAQHETAQLSDIVGCQDLNPWNCARQPPLRAGTIRQRPCYNKVSVSIVESSFATACPQDLQSDSAAHCTDLRYHPKMSKPTAMLARALRRRPRGGLSLLAVCAPAILLVI